MHAKTEQHGHIVVAVLFVFVTALLSIGAAGEVIAGAFTKAKKRSEERAPQGDEEYLCQTEHLR